MMIALQILLLLQTHIIAHNIFNLYPTNHHLDDHCLLYYVHDNIISFGSDQVLAHQLIPYCFRPSANNHHVITNFTNTIDPHFTFAQLRDQHIQSEQLLSWSASIDLAEQYEIFLNNRSQLEFFSVEETLFYNCTPPWFGPFCRFAFDLEVDQSFDTVVFSSFKSRSRLNNAIELPCYTFLDCETPLPCLDWRHICNGRRDCFDGSDELHCWQLEINECAANEYRCHNGQCISAEFFHDIVLNPDCLDRTDEPNTVSLYGCISDPAFRCEEHTCRPGKDGISCSDGQCVSETSRCQNGFTYPIFNDPCSIAMLCRMNHAHLVNVEQCVGCISNLSCIQNRCSAQIEFPPGPFLFGHVRFIYMKREFEIFPFTPPDYVCYNEELCSEFLLATISIENYTCRRFDELGLPPRDSFSSLIDLRMVMVDRFQTCLTVVTERRFCNHSTMYQCKNSTKCISKHRLVDGFRDCLWNDDETFNESCSLNDIHHRFKCLVKGKQKCLAPLNIRDTISHCDNRADERNAKATIIEEYISFQTICDGFQELSPMIIDGQNETHETECAYWPCNNTYTRCDYIWSCKNGYDEINCPKSKCPYMQHECIFPNDISKVSCLSLHQVGDRIIDCFGGTDEREYCRRLVPQDPGSRFFCGTSTTHFTCGRPYQFCSKTTFCKLNDVDRERFCDNRSIPYYDVCDNNWPLSRTRVQELICHQHDNKLTIKFFKIYNIPNYPLNMLMNVLPRESPLEHTATPNSTISLTRTVRKWWYCHRGLGIYVRTEKVNESQFFCLCPPSYYGDRCQFQNQRVSLTLQIRIVSQWRTIFLFLLTLLDEQRNIQSYDYIEYLSIRDCETKFNVYLLYATRPKNASKNYSVQIDVFNKMTLKYQASWIYPLRFPFLPVHRLAVLLKLFRFHADPLENCGSACIHGQCFNYLNNQYAKFCLCNSGWTGIRCNIAQACPCAIGSLCVHGSICICPLGRFGPRCYFWQLSYRSQSCLNSGQYIPNDHRYSSSHSSKPICVCSEQYSGDRCERSQTHINVGFHPSLTIPSVLFIHLISVRHQSEQLRTSLMKKIGFDQNSVSFYTSITFNLVFAELFHQYSLIILQEKDIVSATIFTKINPSHRCAYFHELFNETIIHRHLLRRIKLYHIPCQKRLDLVCFYDETHFCLCNTARESNCFRFNHSVIYNCNGYNVCENGGACFEDRMTCTTSSICVCPKCYYGSKCQFSTLGSSLSLDVILNYGIRQNTPINQQSFVVKVAMTMTMLIFGLGIVNSVLSLLTFRRKKSRDVGCGLYLLISSTTSLMTVVVLALKFWFLLFIQIGTIHNRWFIYIQCISIDFLLQVLVSNGDWLSACVAIERAVTVLLGVNFNKGKSRQVSKWIIGSVFLFVTSTHLHDPIHRHWIVDEEEQRFWCIAKYSSFLQIFNRIQYVFHYSIPFGINCISALIIITSITRTRSVTQNRQSRQRLLRQQFQRHKHLFIASCTLVLLALPRLLIAFLSGCMEPARNPWFYMLGYFISFIPSILTFVIFVLPSKTYMTQFKEAIQEFYPTTN